MIIFYTLIALFKRFMCIFFLFLWLNLFLSPQIFSCPPSPKRKLMLVLLLATVLATLAELVQSCGFAIMLQNMEASNYFVIIR